MSRPQSSGSLVASERRRDAYREKLSTRSKQTVAVFRPYFKSNGLRISGVRFSEYQLVETA